MVVAVVCKVIFVSNPNKVMLVGVELWLSWGFDNMMCYALDTIYLKEEGHRCFLWKRLNTRLCLCVGKIPLSIPCTVTTPN